MVKKLLEHFIKKNCRRIIKKNLELIIQLTVGLTKKILYKMCQYLPKPYDKFGGNINVKVDLSNYATKLDLKNATGIS